MKEQRKLSIDIFGFQQFFLDQLKIMYRAEQFLVDSLPKMQKAAYTEELGNAFSEHRIVTEQQVIRLEAAFNSLGEAAEAKECFGMEGIIKECEEIIAETQFGTLTRDAGLIMGAQKAEHYEIATYGGIITLAKILANNDIVSLLSKTLEEEKLTDELLSRIAIDHINKEAGLLQ